VFEALNDRSFPAGVQTAENLADHGIVDAVVPTADLRDLLQRLLSLVIPHPFQPWRAVDLAGQPLQPIPPVWEAIHAHRSPDRPGLRELLHG